MNFDELIKRAHKLTHKTAYSSIESFTHLVEEVGEVGSAMNCRVTRRKKPKETAAEECVDVIHCALEFFFKEGGTIEYLYEYMNKKMDKWENQINKRKVDK